MSAIKNAYPYQERVAQYLLQGKSVILQAPTGSGKTRAALLPFLHARQHLTPEQFPRKCIYSVPMKVLANQFEAEYQKTIKRFGWQDNLKVGIQTGDRPEDPKVESDLLFTTIDQTLSNFLNIPYGLGKSSANLNAGAILSSYLVFDELHLFDPDTTLPTVLEMLVMLKDITPFVVMTATFSSSMLENLAHLLGAIIVPEPENSEARLEMETIGSQVGKDRRFYAVDAPLTAEAVLAKPAQRVICICNTVRSAQNLYRNLKRYLDERGDTKTQLHLLHSRFYKQDRAQKENWIREQFGIEQTKYEGAPLIQIATQVIEVGVDATCDVLHTELSPASSLLQRAGRCARRANEKGEVHIYLPRHEETNEPDYTPYFMPRQAHKTARGRQLCEATWLALNTSEFTGQHMNFGREQALIDIVHTPIDTEILAEIGHVRYQRRDKMLAAMRNQDYGLISELIRDVDNRFVFIHPNPREDERLEKNPWAYEGFSLYPGAIAQGYKQAEQAEIDSDEIPWFMQTARSIPDKRERDTPANLPQELYRWYPLAKAGEVYSAGVVAVHPGLVHYDSELGFQFAVSEGTPPSPLRKKQRKAELYGYELETYAEHVAGLYQAYTQGKEGHLPLKDEIAFAVNRLETRLPRFNLQPGMLDMILRTLFACHDLGKLNVEWQKWVRDWQGQVGKFYGQDMSLPPDYMAAHTKYDPSDKRQKEAQKKMRPRPNHAGESAMAAAYLLDEICGESTQLWHATITAIARHHSASTNQYQAYKSHKYALDACHTAFQAVDLPTTLIEKICWDVDNVESLTPLLITFDRNSTEGLWLYFLLVRILRLADQRSQAK